MRLGQLSRQLNVVSSEIVDFLADKGIEIKNHPNVKLSEALEKEVFAAFGYPEDLSHQDSITSNEEVEVAPPQEELTNEPEPPSAIIENIDITQGPLVEPDRITEEEKQQEEPETTPEITEDEQPETKETIPDKDVEASLEEQPPVEVIRAPKVKLEGLKVVGKIDLPEPKPETEEKEPEDSTITPKPTASHIVKHSKRNSRRKLTPEELEERRLRNKKAREKRLQKQKEKQKEREEEAIKERKKQYYINKINKEVQQQKVKKSKSKPKVSAQEGDTTRPTTVFGKFWRWLNT